MLFGYGYRIEANDLFSDNNRLCVLQADSLFINSNPLFLVCILCIRVSFNRMLLSPVPINITDTVDKYFSISFILISLFNVQEQIENPFDGDGMDDIQLDNYELEY